MTARLWALDLRSLAVLRIGYGLVILSDLLIRATDLVAHYTDYGLCPRDAVVLLGWQPEYVSLHMASGSWVFQALLFTLAGLASLALTVGWQTRWATVLSWLHLISLHNRNPVVLDGGDIYLRVVLFWAMFLPWGERWSLDSLRRESTPDNLRFDAATLAYQLQIALVYWSAACLKTGAEWRSQGTAVYYAMMIEQLTTPLAGWLLPHPGLMKALTWATLGFETTGPFLLYFNGPLRLLGVLGIVALHAGFGIFMHLGVFCWIGMLSPLGLLPSWFWERLGGRLSAALDRIFAALDRRLADLPGAGPALGPLGPTVSGILAGLAVYCVAWNVGTMTTRVQVPTFLGRLLRIDQQWNMFAPRPLDEDGWYVIEADKLDGSKIDLFHDGAPVSWDKPRDVAGTYGNARWRKFMMNIWAADQSQWRLYYGKYLCRDWNDHHTGQDQISTFRIYFMLEKTLPDGTTAPVEKKMIWDHHCFEVKKY